MNFLEELYLKLFFIGNIKKAPGTFGSILSFIIAYDIILIFKNSYLIILLLVIIVTSITSVPIINNYEKRIKKHDNSSIVIDELVGVFISIFLISFFTTNFVYLFLSLILFRVFDIGKPSIIGIVDKKVGGGLGVMLDDILAGIISGLLSVFIYLIINLL